MRYLCLALLVALVALTGCTSLKRSAELKNPPPITTGGGPMDPNNPTAAPGVTGESGSTTSNETAPAEPAETSTTTTNEGG